MSEGTGNAGGGQRREIGSVDTRPVVAASTVGTIIEWYDFALYGAASALVINELFFPTAGPVVGTLAAFATFAVGFFARPLGGVVIGHYGDRLGRKPALIFTVVLMGLSTVLIGLLPTYEQIGVWAPALLVLLRLLQGFGAGAELAGAITYIAEYTPASKRAFYTAIPNGATAAGLLLATGAFSLVSFLPEEQLLSWGWRLPFVASVVILLVAVFIRQRLQESPAFREELSEGEEPPRLPVREVLADRPRDVFCGFLSVSGHNANAYVLNTFALSYITATLGLEQGIGLLALFVAAGAGIICAPLFGMLADHIGRRPVFIGGATFIALYAFPFFYLLDTESPALVVLAMTLGYGIGFGATSGAQGAFLSELFETRYRYTGISVARELNGVAIAGPTPFIAAALVALAGGSPWFVAIYVIFCQVLTVIGVVYARGLDPSEHDPLEELGDPAMVGR